MKPHLLTSMMKTVVIFMLTVQVKLILQSEVNPEEPVDSAEVLTEPVSFSSVLYTPPRKKQLKLKKAKVVQRKIFDINSLLERVQEEKQRIIQE